MKNEQRHINDELLTKYLLGEATLGEQTTVQAWIEQTDANKAHYEQLKQIWDKSKLLESKSSIDEEAAWSRFQERVNNSESSKTIALPQKRFSPMRIAAAIAVLLCCAWTAKYFMYDYGTTTLYASNEVLVETLPDGSVVTINKNSSIKYDSDFSGDSRDVTLSGEAFFNVTPNKQKPFIISADKATITVVGTSFNVNSSKEATEVIVETGLVKVAKNAESVEVKPSEKATVYNNKTQPVKADNVDKLYNYYRTKEFVCNNTPLSRLVKVLNNAYNVNIVIANDQLNDIAITTTFKDQTLEEILDVISQTFSLTIERSGNNIIIK